MWRSVFWTWEAHVHFFLSLRPDCASWFSAWPSFYIAIKTNSSIILPGSSYYYYFKTDRPMTSIHTTCYDNVDIERHYVGYNYWCRSRCLSMLGHSAICPLNELLLQQERGAQRTACRGRLLIYYYAAGIYASTRLRRRSSRTMLILRNQEVIEDAVLLCLMMTLLSSLFPAHISFLDT